MPTYTWLPQATAQAQLSLRLNDPNNVFWSAAEVWLYIQRSLQLFNVLTYQWKSDFVFNPGTTLWNSLASLSLSPRKRTITDVDCYTQMQYMLLEPASGGTWTGTSQFTLAQFSQALQRKRDEMIQVSNCNQVLLSSIATTPGTTRVGLPDTTIDVARVRYIPNPSYGSPSTLYRDDTVAQEFYEAPLYQQNPGTPQTFSLSSEPPLTFDVDIPPNVPATYEAVVLQTGAAFNPPTPTVLNIPNDFAWALIWGALGDLLGQESEATDRLRAEYCMKRYFDGLQLILKTPWIMLGKVNGQAVTIDSIADADRFSPEWDSSPASFGPFIVSGGIDFFAAPIGGSVGVTVLGNAPLLDGSNNVQVSRSDWDTVLDLAQSLACFKMGGAEFQAALELEKRAIQVCAAENARFRSMGAFSDILIQRGQAQERSQNRYNTAAQKAGQ